MAVDTFGVGHLNSWLAWNSAGGLVSKSWLSGVVGEALTGPG